MAYFKDTFFEVRGNLHLRHYNDYMDLPKTIRGYSLTKDHALLENLHEWFDVELSKPRYTESRFEGKVLHLQLEPVFMKARQRILSILPDVYAVRAYGSSIYSLVGEALKYVRWHGDCDYSRCDAFFSLIEIDKTFITSNWGSDLVRLAEFHQQKEFFRKMSKAIMVPGFRERFADIEYGLATIMLWHIGGKKITYPKLHKVLWDQGYCYYRDKPASFKKFANRLGLKKYRKVGR